MSPTYGYLVLFYQPEDKNLEPQVLVLRRQKSPVWFAHPPMSGRPMEEFLADKNFLKEHGGCTFYLPRGISYDKYFIGKYPGKLCFPGGQANDNETIESCAKREFLEETGVDICQYDCSLRLGMRSWQMEDVVYGMMFIQLSPEDFQQVKQRILLKLDANDQYRANIVRMAASSTDFTPTMPPLTDDEFTKEPLHSTSHDVYGSDWEMTLTDAIRYFDMFQRDGMDWFLQFVGDLQVRLA
ncbi:NUDIX hydrolase [archaeon]|nr:MAG: NUDIX hydrolase [archaeon]